MYEEKKNKTTRSFAIRIFVDLPWVVRAFLSLLILMLFAIIVFGLLGLWVEVPAFNQVAEELTGYLKLVVGAIIGALSSEAKNYLKREEP